MSHAIRDVADPEQELRTVRIPDGQSTSQTVIETVASVEGVEPAELSTPLYESVDPDALESLCDTSTDWDHPPRVVFTFAEYEICVVAGRHVTLRELGDHTQP